MHVDKGGTAGVDALRFQTACEFGEGVAAEVGENSRPSVLRACAQARNTGRGSVSVIRPRFDHSISAEASGRGGGEALAVLRHAFAGEFGQKAAFARGGGGVQEIGAGVVFGKGGFGVAGGEQAAAGVAVGSGEQDVLRGGLKTARRSSAVWAR